MAVMLDSRRIIGMCENPDKYDKQINSWYEMALNDEDEKIQHHAADSLFSFYLRKKDYVMAEKYLNYFSDYDPAKRLYLGRLYKRENCRVGKSKAKERSYSITQASEKNLERLKFEESEYFQERMKIRYRIEEKNGELKEAHGLRKADSRGLFAMHLQMYFTAFTANVKRIVRLEELAME